MKNTVVQKGIADEDLRRHLVIDATRLPSYNFKRDMARATLSGLAPMDVSAVYKGKGKGKGKGKEKGKKGKWKDKDNKAAVNPGAEVICYCCHRKGHRKRDCRTMGKDKPKKGQPVNAVEQALAQGAAASPNQHDLRCTIGFS